MRMRLEQALQAVAVKCGLSVSKKTIGVSALAKLLNSANVVSAEIASELESLSAVLNSAVHGKEIEARDAQHALQLGTSLLSRLEK